METVGSKWLNYVFPYDLPRVTVWLGFSPKEGEEDWIDYRVVTEGKGIVWVRHWLLSMPAKRKRLAPVHGLLVVLNEQKLLEAECLRICERERMAIGQELHDDICQLMVGLSCMLDVLGKQISTVRPDLHAQLDDLSAQVHQGMERTRVLAHGLVPARLVSLGISRALLELARQTKMTRQIEVTVSAPAISPLYSDEQVLHLYRIAQEAISNSIKHGKATLIDIVLRNRGQQHSMTIKDNGIGLPPPSNRAQGIGMHVMQFRAGILGGSLRISSRPAKGVTIKVAYAGNCRPDPLTPDIN